MGGSISRKKHLENSSQHAKSEFVENDEIDFNSFKILRSIGKGAFGKVCIVEKCSDAEMYAMKYMNKKLCVKKTMVSHVVEEVLILQELHHKFVVNLWFSFQDNEDFFLVVDLMVGGDLNYHLQKGVIFTEKTIMIYLLQMGSAIEYIHSRNIIHRDIKPANILLDKNGNLNLSDFNIAKKMNSSTDTLHGFAGTKPYAAPEVHKSSVDKSCGYSFPVDWWSLAVTMYEILRCKKPFFIYAETHSTTCIEMFERGNISFSSGWSQSLIEVFLELFVVNPSSRLCSVNQLLQHEFCSTVKSAEEIMSLQSEFKPSTKNLNYDPTHELEEMLIESKPLHKKSRRLKRQHDGENMQFEEYPTFVRLK